MKLVKAAFKPLWFLCILISTQVVTDVGGSNVLAIFQHFGFSHFRVYYPILQELAVRGHNVTVISYVKNPSPHPNYKELLLTGEALIHVTTFDDFVVGRSPDILLSEYLALHHEGQHSCKKFYESSHVETVLASHAQNPYDLVLTEYFNTDCHLGVPYLMDVPVVAFSSCALMPWLYERILLPDMPSYIQSEFIGFPENMSILQRLLNFIQMKSLKWLYRYHTNKHDNQLIKRYLNVDIDVYEVAKRLTSVIFVNQHYTLSGSRPLTPQLVELGGVHITEKRLNESLPRDVVEFLSKIEANEDVIVISFGSVLKSASFDRFKLKVMAEVLQKRKFKVIWKWEGQDMPLQSANILFVKWLPQLSLLCHPKVKYFWGHGGLLSTTETVYCGKPPILTPIYGDQFLNAHAVQNRKAGFLLDYHLIDEQNVEMALNEIQRPRYATNALALSKLFRDRDMPPLSKAIWQIEFLLKHKRHAVEVLQTKGVNLNFFVYYSLDSILLIFLALVALFILSLIICKGFCSRRRNKHSQLASDDRKNR